MHLMGAARLRPYGGNVRKLPAGLFSLALAATAGLGGASASDAATPPQAVDSARVAGEVSGPDELSSPLEDKRRELRQEALTQVLNGTATPEKRGASTVVNLGSKPAGATGVKNASGRVDQYVEL